MSRRSAALSWLATGLASLSVVSCLAAIPWAYWLEGRADVEIVLWGDLVLGTAWPVAGALVVRAAPGNAVGWVLVSASLIGPYHVAGYYTAMDAEPAWELPLADLAGWVAVWGFAPYFWVLPLVLLLFPDGHALSRRWRWVVRCLVVVAAVTVVSRMLSPVTTDIARSVLNPWAPPWEWTRYVTLAGSLACVFAGNVLGLVSVLLRTRRSVGRHRTQMQWLLLGGSLLLVGLALPLPDLAGDVALAVGLTGPPVAIAVAVLRHGLFDVEFALNRTIVLGVLSSVVVATYALSVLLLGQVGMTSGPGLLLVAGAALAAASLRGAVQRAVDRWLFGHRSDPYAVVSRVGRNIAPAGEPGEALELLVDALRRALRLPYVAFLDEASGRPLAVAGSPVPDVHVEAVSALGQPMGELRVGLRRPTERLLPEELEAIGEVAARAGTLAYAARLVTDVASSRARIVAAREEERRRLRDDLHDGLGPTLAGTAHQLEALATRLGRSGDEDAAGRALALRDRMRGTVADVRSIVHGLRPPVLDQQGLAGALQGLVAGFETPRCRVDVSALAALSASLPAAVEVAAYAIASEAVTNAVRHSVGSELTVVARTADGALVIEVADNGQGLHGRTKGGVGLVSMGERAAEVGGRVELLDVPSGGCLVRATLPLGEGAAP